MEPGLTIQSRWKNNYKENSAISTDYHQSVQGEGKSSFSTLSEEEKKNVEKKNPLLDKFCVGDAFYHELSMITDGLPRSNLVKQCHDDLYKMCQIDSPDANFEEAKVNSVKLCPKNISLIISKKNNDFDPINGKIKIKINGDGARMTRNSNFILLSFPILQTRESVMSDKGNRTLGIVNGSQSYLIFF